MFSDREVGLNLKVYRQERVDVKKRMGLTEGIFGPIFAKTGLVQERPVTDEDFQIIKQVTLEYAPFFPDKADSHLIRHFILASIYQGKISERVAGSSLTLAEAQVLGFIHDFGRFDIAHRYLTNNVVEWLLFKRLGVRQDLTTKLYPVPGVIGVRRFGSGQVIESTDDLSLEQIINDVADNMGKLNPDGSLFSVEQFVSYSTGQPKRYTGGVWASERRGLKALTLEGKQRHAIELLLQEIELLRTRYGIDFDGLRQAVFKEFSQPAVQSYLYDFRDSRESLDPRIDELLGRPPVGTIIFDVGGVLNQDADPALLKNLVSYFSVSEDQVLEAFSGMNDLAMAGQINEEEYLRRFWEYLGKTCPVDIEVARKPFVQPDIYLPVEGMYEIIRDLAGNQDLRLYVLSNIIPPLTSTVSVFLRTHYPFLNPDNIYYSCDIKASKKEVNTPEVVLQRIGNPDPGSVLFIDDVTGYVDLFRRNNTRAFTFQNNPYSGTTSAERLRNELELANII